MSLELCSKKDCTDEATVKTEYKDNSDSKKLCENHFEFTDENGLKIYQINLSKMVVLN